MFVEHKEALEVTEAPVRITKLSQAMRIGCLMRPPTKVGARVYFDKCGSCALGAAYQALTGKCTQEHRIGDKLIALLGLPYNIPGDASEFFETGAKTSEQVADWLEAQGY